MASNDARSPFHGTARRFLVTGAAGFIGSHLLEALLRMGQCVVGLDNFANGTRNNLADALGKVWPGVGHRYRFIEGDIRDPAVCAEAMRGIDVVLHEAALASVPRSIEDPESFYSVNVEGFSNILAAARNANVKRIVYASSSSVYGDDASPEKKEDKIGRPLSPYASTKLMGEIEAGTFQRATGIRTVGLRYFNVFGPRQNPEGPYAAVIPRWIESLIRRERCVVFGDGTATRDFCFVENVVHANVLAATVPDSSLVHDVFNVACGERTRLIDLFHLIRHELAAHRPDVGEATPRFDSPRAGDIPHSLASIERTRSDLGYEPSCNLLHGLGRTVEWYTQQDFHAIHDEARGTTHA